MADSITPTTIQTSNPDATEIYNYTGGSPQLRFAALQMTMAQISKDKAMDYMDQIEAAQAESKQVADMIARARALQSHAAANGEEGLSEMPADMVQFFKDRGLPYDTVDNDNLHTKAEWDFNITSLTNYQQSVGSNTQQLMVFIQD
ncbi:MAG: hypothetical protein LBV23_01775, partial [Deltaproteobacteria bacterium]|nr:hypothetical protein [Deltaproteobacteria bacterium]